MSNDGSSWIPDDDLKGLSDNFFEDLIDHFDLPLEDIETVNDDGDWDAGFKDLIPPPLDVFNNLSVEFARGQQRVGVQNSIPALKQSCSSDVSSIVNITLPDVKVSKLFKSSSPVSVLDSNANGSVTSQNSYRATERLASMTSPVKGIRSKRKRSATMKARSLHSFGSLASTHLDESDSETYLPSEGSIKKRRKKATSKALQMGQCGSVSHCGELFNADGTVRKCSHCETTKTPQWREGPNGPKTLCNACGVRFRSGRLVPEYRPASSPTFIPTVHSNSHRKIVEMRKKGDDQFDTKMIHTGL